MDESTARILKYVELADRSGKRFAYKNGKYEPECIAEARFILAHTILENHKLLDKAENEEIFLKIVISRRLRNYFAPRYHSEKVGIPVNADHHDDFGLIDELESLFPGHDDLFGLWREGFDLNDLLFLNNGIRSIRRDLMKVKQKLIRSRKAREAKINAINNYEKINSDRVRESA